MADRVKTFRSRLQRLVNRHDDVPPDEREKALQDAAHAVRKTRKNWEPDE